MERSKLIEEIRKQQLEHLKNNPMPDTSVNMDGLTLWDNSHIHDISEESFNNVVKAYNEAIVGDIGYLTVDSDPEPLGYKEEYEKNLKALINDLEKKDES